MTVDVVRRRAVLIAARMRGHWAGAGLSQSELRTGADARALNKRQAVIIGPLWRVDMPTSDHPCLVSKRTDPKRGITTTSTAHPGARDVRLRPSQTRVRRGPERRCGALAPPAPIVVPPSYPGLTFSALKSNL